MEISIPMGNVDGVGIFWEEGGWVEGVAVWRWGMMMGGVRRLVKVPACVRAMWQFGVMMEHLF